MKSLKTVLESAYSLYHKPEYLRTDPLVCVHGFGNGQDIEIVGLIAAVLAYGRVEIIIRNVSLVLDRISQKPYEFTMNTSYREKLTILKDFKHRFNDTRDIALLFECIARSIREFGSLEGLFLSYSKSGCFYVKDGLDHFTGELKKTARKITPDVPSSFEYLLPSPSSGSACKRLNMYLRWMVRKADLIDFGIWNGVSPSILIVPVDTHIAKIGRQLEFTKRNSADWRMAEEITAGLKKYDPADPVRFDFSLCRAGMFSFRKDAA
jgi:uncharacterized protein (TIGR02757 family)